MSQSELSPACAQIVTATTELLYNDFQDFACIGFTRDDIGHSRTKLIRRVAVDDQIYADVTTNSNDFSTPSRTIDCRMGDMVDIITHRGRYSLYTAYNGLPPGYMFTWNDAATPNVLREVVRRAGIAGEQQLGNLVTALPPIRTETYHTANYQSVIGEQRATVRAAAIETTEGKATSRTRSLRFSLENNFDYWAEMAVHADGRPSALTKVEYHDRTASKGVVSVREQLTLQQLSRVALAGGQMLHRLHYLSSLQHLANDS